jgi:hypothetical protein
MLWCKMFSGKCPVFGAGGNVGQWKINALTVV